MIHELAVGISVNVAVMLVHLSATFILIGLVAPYEGGLLRRPHLRLMMALAIAGVVLLFAHLAEVAIWALVYSAMGLVQHSGDAFYSAFVNYTTLGYGDALQETHTRLLGPFASASGILMFGWSTAILISVLQRHLPSLEEHRRQMRRQRDPDSRD